MQYNFQFIYNQTKPQKLKNFIKKKRKKAREKNFTHTHTQKNKEKRKSHILFSNPWHLLREKDKNFQEILARKEEEEEEEA